MQVDDGRKGVEQVHTPEGECVHVDDYEVADQLVDMEQVQVSEVSRKCSTRRKVRVRRCATKQTMKKKKKSSKWRM